MTGTRTETYEARAMRLALEATDPHVAKTKRTRSLLALSTLLRQPTIPGKRRLVTAARLLIEQPELTSVMPDTHDWKGEEL